MSLAKLTGVQENNNRTESQNTSDTKINTINKQNIHFCNNPSGYVNGTFIFNPSNEYK